MFCNSPAIKSASGFLNIPESVIDLTRVFLIVSMSPPALISCKDLDIKGEIF